MNEIPTYKNLNFQFTHHGLNQVAGLDVDVEGLALAVADSEVAELTSNRLPHDDRRDPEQAVNKVAAAVFNEKPSG